jgi:hypothetical protein
MLNGKGLTLMSPTGSLLGASTITSIDYARFAARRRWRSRLLNQQVIDRNAPAAAIFDNVVYPL